MIQVKLKLLKAIDDDNEISQRALALITDVSLGKVNSMIKDLEEENKIERFVVGRKTKYKVTPLGKEYLEEAFSDIKNTKLTINRENTNKKVKIAVILAAGKQRDFDIPVGCLSLGNETIIERNISVLKEAGIEKIILITGYKNEEYKWLFKDSKIIEVINSDYENTGTMASLEKAKSHIDDDFILIESDVIYEKKALNKIVKSKNRDCILITPVTGIGDEAFVEIRDNYVYKMSKDIHQFNKIDGEMIGITKISSNLFALMLKEFSNNKNPYINYEYTLLDVGRNYNIGYERVTNLIWGEVDTKEQYEVMLNDILRKIKEKENK